MNPQAKVVILRTTGEREVHNICHRGGDLLRWIHKQINAEYTDSVNLRDGRVMIVNDHGYETEMVQNGQVLEIKCLKALLPVNAEATKIYQALCYPGTTHQIVGDIAIAWDEDFA